MAFYAYWETDPPTHEMVASIAVGLGWKRPERPTAKPVAQEKPVTIAELKLRFGDGVIRG